MIVTDRERTVLIQKYGKMVDYLLRKWRGRLNYLDFEELHSDCMMSISRAIDYNDESKGNALSTIVSLCIHHAKYDWVEKYYAYKRQFVRVTYTFTDIEHDGKEYVAGECPETPVVFEKEDRDWPIMLDKLRETSLLSKDDWFVLDRMSSGYLDKEIGVEMGKSRQMVQKRKVKALGKLRIALEV
jgi:DNA-directed RNA polymerase specialized sigma24 family protein